jgi:hypothetical protein
MKRRLRLSTVLIVLIGLWSITLVTSMNWSFSNYARHGKEVINTNQWVGIEDMGFTYDWEEYRSITRQIQWRRQCAMFTRLKIRELHSISGCRPLFRISCRFRDTRPFGPFEKQM